MLAAHIASSRAGAWGNAPESSRNPALPPPHHSSTSIGSAGAPNDSIPSDLSVYALYHAAREDGEGQLAETDFVLRSFSGGVSGGTIASMIEVLNAASSDPEVRRQLADPYTLSPDRAAEPELGSQPDLPWPRGGQIAPELTGLWTAGVVETLTPEKIAAVNSAMQLDAAGLQRIIEGLGQMTMLRRAPALANVAEAATFLASDRASGITGAITNVTCGLVPG